LNNGDAHVRRAAFFRIKEWCHNRTESVSKTDIFPAGLVLTDDVIINILDG
jgi:hypothetical protein